MTILLILITALIFWGSNRREFTPDLGKQDTEMLKGAFALLVFSHHIYQNLNLWQPFRVLADVGFLWVGGFFFLSGYGLYKSLATNENYFEGYFKKRLSAVIFPFFLVNALELLIRMGVGERYHIKEAVGSFFLFPMLDGNHWFLVAILFFYVAFYLAYRFLPKWAGHIVIFVAVTLYIVLFSELTHGQTWWYNAVYAFPAGILWAGRKKHSFRLPWALSLGGFLLFFGLEYVMGLDRQKTFFFMVDYMNPIASTKSVEGFIFLFQLLSAVSLSIFIALSMQKFRIGNALLSFYGKISYEFYLIHGCVIFALKSRAVYVVNDTLFGVLALLSSTFLASALHQIIKALKKEKNYVSGK